MSADPVQREPTMDEILSSIRRIVSDDEVVVSMPSKADAAPVEPEPVSVEYAEGSGAPGYQDEVEATDDEPKVRPSVRRESVRKESARRQQPGFQSSRDSAPELGDEGPAAEIPRTLQSAIDEGLENNLDVGAARAEEAAALHRLRVAKGDLMPMVEASGKISAAQMRADRARFDRIAVERSVTAAITNSWHDMVAARMDIRDTQTRVSYAKANLENAQMKLSVGERFTPDVLALEKELLESRLSLVDAKRNGWHAAHRLLAAIGRVDGGALAD